MTTRDNAPKSRYDGLGLELNKRFSNSLALNGSYTLARHLSDAGVYRADCVCRGKWRHDRRFLPRRCRLRERRVYAPASVHQHVPVRAADRALAEVDERHRARDERAHRRMGCHRSAPAAIRAVPHAFVLQRRSFGNGYHGSRLHRHTRPDAVGDGNLANPTADAYFDRNAFVRPADNIGRFGNAEVGTLVGPERRRSR